MWQIRKAIEPPRGKNSFGRVEERKRTTLRLCLGLKKISSRKLRKKGDCGGGGKSGKSLNFTNSRETSKGAC